MSRRHWSMGLSGVILAMIGVWGAWVWHRVAALVVSGWDLAEFVKFVPGASAVRELFYVPVWCGAIILAFLAHHPVAKPDESTRQQFVNMAACSVLFMAAVALMIAILPPYPQLIEDYGSAESRWRFVLGVSGLLLVGVSWLAQRWLRRMAGPMLVALALIGALPALWQFLKVREPIEAVYGSPIGWGWGVSVFLSGWTMVGGAGAWVLWSRITRSYG